MKGLVGPVLVHRWLGPAVSSEEAKRLQAAAVVILFLFFSRFVVFCFPFNFKN